MLEEVETEGDGMGFFGFLLDDCVDVAVAVDDTVQCCLMLVLSPIDDVRVRMMS